MKSKILTPQDLDQTLELLIIKRRLRTLTREFKLKS